MKSKATSFDIAHMAGVSQSTVSRALSDSPLVNKETRNRIKQIAKDLNYKVDKNASNLRRQHSQTLALLLFEDPTSDDSLINPFFISMLGSITKASSAAGYDLLVSFQNLKDDWHADFADSNKADGLILLGYGSYTDYEHKLYQLEEQGTRFIRWGAPDQNHPGVSIGCDNYQGGLEITKHLLQVGHRCFGFVGDVGQHAPELKARFDGFKQALTDVNIQYDENMQTNAISTEEEGFIAGKELLDKGHVDAIVCASDLMAMGVIRAARSRGLRVPSDIAVVGYDNIQVSQFAATPLTTVNQNTRLAGELLVNNLLKIIRNEAVSDYLMPPELIIRDSCGVNQ